MKSGWRIVIAAAAAALAAAAPASAQNAVTPAPPGNSTDVGPPQLRDFTLNGTVTRPAQAPPPARTPAVPPPSPRPSATTSLPPARPPAAASPEQAPARREATVELAPPTPPASPPPSEAISVETPASPAAAPALAPEGSAIPAGPGLLPWLFAALLIGAGAAYYLVRVRPRALAASADGDGLQLAEPTPARPAAPVPELEPDARPRAVLPAGGAVVSTTLRPWIEVDFIPERTIVAEDSIAIEYTLALYNSGGAPARDVRIEASMVNANPGQDQQIRAFFASPAGRGDRIEAIAPLQRVMVRNAVTVARTQVSPLLADGRPLLVPMTALNILYRWGSNNHGQTSASHLVGKDTGADKLAPFRLDLGPRVFRGLAAREHQLRVRS